MLISLSRFPVQKTVSSMSITIKKSRPSNSIQTFFSPDFEAHRRKRNLVCFTLNALLCFRKAHAHTEYALVMSEILRVYFPMYNQYVKPVVVPEHELDKSDHGTCTL